MVRPDMLHARILRQPCRGATLASFNEAAIRRAAGGDFRIVRVGNFVAFVGADETVVQRAAAAAPLHARWENAPALTADMQEAAWLVGKPSNDRVLYDEIAPVAGTVVEASYSRPYVAHASMAPSCALAEIATGICRSGRTRRDRIRCGRRWRTCWAWTRTRSPCGMRMAPAVMAITAPTTWRWMRR